MKPTNPSKPMNPIDQKGTPDQSAMAKKISVDAHPHYLHSAKIGNEMIHLFRYTITIHNNSDEPVQLLERHWRIGDGKKVEEVHGKGVIGTQPTIQPKGHFCYTSGVSLGSSSGEMLGCYVMSHQDNKQFKVQIPKFILAAPQALN